jgi:putative hydrolase of the HAD superfamily
VKAVLFDFFGTLVEYQPDRTRLFSPETYEFARSVGYVGDHDSFVEVWDVASRSLERTARATLREFSMTDAAMAFGEAAQLDLAVDDAETLGRSYVREWGRHVHPIPGVPDLIRRLAEDHKLAIVSNTHDPSMVPDMVSEMGLSDEISAVVLSIEHGWLKPHPSIYVAALESVACVAEEVAFVGNNYEADYLGPLAAGMSAFLIDPAYTHRIPSAARLASVHDVASRIDDPPGQ